MPKTAKTSKESSSNTSNVTGNSRSFSSIGNPPYRQVTIQDPPSSLPTPSLSTPSLPTPSLPPPPSSRPLLDERDQGDHVKKLHDVIQKLADKVDRIDEALRRMELRQVEQMSVSLFPFRIFNQSG
jgi:hypothetical protein